MNNKTEILQQLKKIYNQKLDYMGIKGAELNRFMWSDEKKIRIYAYNIYSTLGPYGYVIFATESTEDDLIEDSFVEETHTYEFESLFTSETQLNYLAKKIFCLLV